MRIGFLSTVDARDPTAISGVPFHMRRELARLGDVVDLMARVPARPRWTSGFRRLLPPRLRHAARALVSGVAGRVGPPPPGPTYDQVLAEAARLSRFVAAQVASHPLDVLFGFCASQLLFCLDTSLPVVLASDSTARLMRDTYWAVEGRSKGAIDAFDLLERTALGRCAQAVFSTTLARGSAIEHYGVHPDRAHVLPVGANVVPERALTAPAPIEPPMRSDLRLLFVGLDPVRKRLDLAVEAVEALRAEGWSARLDVIGRDTPRARRSPWVHRHGPLDLASPVDRAVQRRAFERAHALLLPSEAEAFGLAPGEAAHHGRPSVVSSAGGLPEVVIDGETGAVLPLHASPRDYARAIVALVGDPVVYARACDAALRRAQRVLSWDRWRVGVAPILERALADPGRPSERASA